MSHKHLSIFQRAQLEALKGLDLSNRKIADKLGCHHSTVGRELKRGSIGTEYSAVEAQEDYCYKRKNSARKSTITNEHISLIEEHLKLSWSPEQIKGKYSDSIVSFKTIYRWIYEGYIANGKEFLRRKGRKQKHLELRGKIKDIRTIHDRPYGANTREEFGHWELDTVVSSRGKSKGCLATFLERKTRMYITVPMQDRTSLAMFNAVSQVVKSYPEEAFKSFTSDRGKEFSCHKEIEKKLGIPLYFADAYASWQRGSNENANGLLREYLPKKTDIAKVSKDYLYNSLKKILDRPRKLHGWKSVYEVFHDEVLHLI